MENQDTTTPTTTTTTTLTVTYDLTQEAQRAEALAGRPAHARREVEIALPVAEVLAWPWTALRGDGTIDHGDPPVGALRVATGHTAATGSACPPLPQPAILTPEAALIIVRERAAAWCAALRDAEVLRAAELEAQRAAAESFEAALALALDRVERGESAITATDSGFAYWIEIDGAEIVLGSAHTPARDRARDAIEVWRAAEAARAEAEEAARMAERDAWIREHGSERLRLALDLGEAERVRGVYLDERRAVEAPGFRRVEQSDARGDHSLKDRLNPALDELRALTEARKNEHLTEVDLVSVCELGDTDDECEDGHTYLPAIRATWRGQDVIRVID